MLKSRLLQPEILDALARAGHGSRILVGDGNYPILTASAPAARRVYLNLAPGLVLVTDVLEALVSAIPVESAAVMNPATGPEPKIFAEFRRHLPNLSLDGLGRFEFYDAARGTDVALAIATGDQRLYSNILLTIGVVGPDGQAG
jgi:L-fucose mutarotase